MAARRGKSKFKARAGGKTPARTRRKPARPHAKKNEACFSVALSTAPGAPRQPGSASLRTLFTRAWALVPASRRPEIPAGYLRRIAIDVMVVGDAKIAELNRAHLRHEGPTDVLSFPMGEIDPERRVFSLGEIVVSFETARREAAARRLRFDEELARYCVHGFLHLLGYEDETRAQREELFALQEKALAT